MVKRAGIAVVVAGLALAPLAPIQAQQLPFGTYMTECDGVRMVDGTLIADCPRNDKSMRQTTLPNALNCGADIENQDGHLVCTRSRPAQAPTPPPGGRVTSAQRAGYGTFGNICKEGQGSEFLAIRWAGRTDDVRKFVFDGATKIHLQMPQGTTVAANCGGMPGPDKRFDFKALDGG